MTYVCARQPIIAFIVSYCSHHGKRSSSHSNTNTWRLLLLLERYHIIKPLPISISISISISHHPHPSCRSPAPPVVLLLTLGHGITKTSSDIEPGARILPSDTPPPGLVKSPLHWTETRLERGAAALWYPAHLETGTITGASSRLVPAKYWQTGESSAARPRERVLAALFSPPAQRKRRHWGNKAKRLTEGGYSPAPS